MTLQVDESLSETGRTEACVRQDLTGRDRMAWNVLASWAGQMVFVVAGFVMPRFMDRHIGQAALGVWDFGWSLVSYFGIAQVGIGSSVNRYVAKYRAEQDIDGLNRAVASVMCIQVAAGAVVLMLTVAAVVYVPSLLGHRLGQYVDDARWVVAFLGAALAIQVFFNAYVGIVTGCHRWDLHNFIAAGAHVLTAALMVTALCWGGGLRSLAVVNFAGTFLAEVVRAVVGHRVCPELRVRVASASRSESLEMFAFGGKTMLNSLSRLLLYQTNSMFIVAFLGPGALAVYSRSKSLVTNAQMFVNRLGFVLTPTASSLQAAGRTDELRELSIQTSRFAAFMALPMVLVLSILGDPILRLWMGPGYQQGAVLAVLAVGHLAEMTGQPAVNILAGMNMHGRLGMVNLFVGILSVALGALCVGVLQWGLIGAALSVAVPLILVNGIYVPVYVSRRLGMGVWSYLAKTNQGPFLCAMPFALCLIVARLTFGDRPYCALASGGGAGGIILGTMYWWLVVPQNTRARIGGWLRRTVQVLLRSRPTGYVPASSTQEKS